MSNMTKKFSHIDKDLLWTDKDPWSVKPPRHNTGELFAPALTGPIHEGFFQIDKKNDCKNESLLQEMDTLSMQKLHFRYDVKTE